MGDSWFTVTHFVLKQIHLFLRVMRQKNKPSPRFVGNLYTLSQLLFAKNKNKFVHLLYAR